MDIPAVDRSDTIVPGMTHVPMQTISVGASHGCLAKPHIKIHAFRNGFFIAYFRP